MEFYLPTTEKLSFLHEINENILDQRRNNAFLNETHNDSLVNHVKSINHYTSSWYEWIIEKDNNRQLAIYQVPFFVKWTSIFYDPKKEEYFNMCVRVETFMTLTSLAITKYQLALHIKKKDCSLAIHHIKKAGQIFHFLTCKELPKMKLLSPWKLPLEMNIKISASLSLFFYAEASRFSNTPIDLIDAYTKYKVITNIWTKYNVPKKFIKKIEEKTIYVRSLMCEKLSSQMIENKGTKYSEAIALMEEAINCLELLVKSKKSIQEKIDILTKQLEKLNSANNSFFFQSTFKNPIESLFPKSIHKEPEKFDYGSIFEW